MRGYLLSNNARLWFELSSERLTYHSERGDDELGALHVDSLKRIQARRKRNKHYSMELEFSPLDTFAPARTASGSCAAGCGIFSMLRTLFLRLLKQEPPNSHTELVASTSFEAEAWKEALYEVRAAVVTRAAASHWSQVRRLVHAGRDCNVKELRSGRSALHYAAGYGEVAAARDLVDAGASVNAQDRTGMTALGFACRKGNVALVELLLRASADPLIAAHSGVLDGQTALTLARLHGAEGAAATERAHEIHRMLLLHRGAACFRVGRRLGRGGFGDVFIARRAELPDEKWAIKVVRKSRGARVVAQAHSIASRVGEAHSCRS